MWWPKTFYHLHTMQSSTHWGNILNIHTIWRDLTTHQQRQRVSTETRPTTLPTTLSKTQGWPSGSLACQWSQVLYCQAFKTLKLMKPSRERTKHLKTRFMSSCRQRSNQRKLWPWWLRTYAESEEARQRLLGRWRWTMWDHLNIKIGH